MEFRAIFMQPYGLDLSLELSPSEDHAKKTGIFAIIILRGRKDDSKISAGFVTADKHSG